MIGNRLVGESAGYPEVPIVFAGSRRFAEEWTYRFFGAAVGDTAGETVGDGPADASHR